MCGISVGEGMERSADINILKCVFGLRNATIASLIPLHINELMSFLLSDERNRLNLS